MSKNKTNDYRVRIMSPHTVSRESFQRTYVVRKDGRVSYISSNETPLALSYLVMHNAAESRFVLEDALDGSDAAKHLRTVLAEQYKNNKALLPMVEAL